MSHHTGVGFTSTPGDVTYASGINTQDVIWVPVTPMSGSGGYVDTIHFYCGGGDAGLIGGHNNSINSVFFLLAWNGSQNVIMCQTSSFSIANGAQWNSHTLGPTLVGPTSTLGVGWWSDPSTFRCWKANNSSNSFYHNDSSAGSLGSQPSGSPTSGLIGAYFDYWDPAAIFSVPSSLQLPGNVIQVTGTSFSQGVSSCSIGGVNCPTFSVDSDSQVSITIPSNAVTGTVSIVTSGVGTAVSSGTVTIGPGGWVHSAGVLNRVKGVWYHSGGVLNPVKGIWVHSGGVLHPTK